MSAILTQNFVLLHSWGRCPEGAEGVCSGTSPIERFAHTSPMNGGRQKTLIVFSGERLK
jgi:hypothetical protein